MGQPMARYPRSKAMMVTGAEKIWHQDKGIATCSMSVRRMEANQQQADVQLERQMPSSSSKAFQTSREEEEDFWNVHFRPSTTHSHACERYAIEIKENQIKPVAVLSLCLVNSSHSVLCYAMLWVCMPRLALLAILLLCLSPFSRRFSSIISYAVHFPQ